MRALQQLGVLSTVVSLSVFMGWSAAKADTLLNTQGTLTTGDAVLDDGSLYDQHTFSGNSGEQVTISLESQAFDPYLILLDPDGNRISENDDISHSNRNSQLRVILPSTGLYIVVANSYESGKNGDYKIRIDVGDYQSSTPEAIAASIPNSSTLCNSTLEGTLARLKADRDVGILVSALRLNTLYEEIISARPYGLNMAFSGPATESLLTSPQVLNQASSELIQNCDSLGAVIFGSAEVDGEEVFGYIPALENSRNASNSFPVSKFACAPIAPEQRPAAPTQRPTPQWGEQVCL